MNSYETEVHVKHKEQQFTSVDDIHIQYGARPQKKVQVSD
jgi:hypothetical protein